MRGFKLGEQGEEAVGVSELFFGGEFGCLERTPGAFDPAGEGEAGALGEGGGDDLVEGLEAGDGGGGEEVAVGFEEGEDGGLGSGGVAGEEVEVGEGEGCPGGAEEG